MVILWQITTNFTLWKVQLSLIAYTKAVIRTQYGICSSRTNIQIHLQLLLCWFKYFVDTTVCHDIATTEIWWYIVIYHNDMSIRILPSTNIYHDVMSQVTYIKQNLEYCMVQNIDVENTGELRMRFSNSLHFYNS